MTNLSLEPKNLTEAMEFSQMLAQSSLVPSSFRGKPQDILVAVQWGYELNLKPLQSLQNLTVINGRPSIWGDAMIALVKSDKRCLGIKEKVEGEGDNMVATCTVKRAYGNEVEETTSKFSVGDAIQAKLWKKQGPWSQYPKRMLQMRARGFALRDAFSDVLKGVISAEEAQDYPTNDKPKQPVNITPETPKLMSPEDMINECTDIDTLKSVWGALTLDDRTKFENLKNEKKEQFENLKNKKKEQLIKKI